MIRHKDNDKLKLDKVTTINGKIEYRKNCRKIKDKFYVMNEDCVEIKGKWYVATSKLVTYDYDKKEWVLVKDNPSLVYGVVDFKKDGSPIFGNFTENKYENILASIGNYGSARVLNEKTLKTGGYVEHIGTGLWHYGRNLTPAEVLEYANISSRRVYREKGYNIEDNAEEFKEKIDAYKEYKIKIGLAAARYGKLLGDTSYGVEVETAMGFIPDHIQWRTGVIICRDGSIDNAEYVTVPLSGAKGLINLKNLSVELIKRTTTDHKCSFHIHLGTLPKDRLFLVALYILAMKIQDEMFTMFPGYKTDWKRVKKQDYNQKLRKLGIPVFKGGNKEDYTSYIDDGYYRIQKFLNDGNEADDLYNRTNHRHVRQNKWERKARYFWMNLMNMFFSDRNTVEFRLHHNTVNAQKMINWLFICNAIVRYADAHSKEIISSRENIKLDDILNYYGEHFKTKEALFLSEYLKAYVQDRKDYFAKDIAKGDILSKQETEDDKTYVFTYEGVSNLF